MREYSNVKYLVVMELNGLEIGLRDEGDHYCLDFLVHSKKDDILNAVNKHTMKKSLVAEKIGNGELDNHQLSLLFNTMLTGFLLNVKSE